MKTFIFLISLLFLHGGICKAQISQSLINAGFIEAPSVKGAVITFNVFYPDDAPDYLTFDNVNNGIMERGGKSIPQGPWRDNVHLNDSQVLYKIFKTVFTPEEKAAFKQLDPKLAYIGFILLYDTDGIIKEVTFRMDKSIPITPLKLDYVERMIKMTFRYVFDYTGAKTACEGYTGYGTGRERINLVTDPIY